MGTFLKFKYKLEANTVTKPIIQVIGNTHLDALGDHVTLTADQNYDWYEWLFKRQSISNSADITVDKAWYYVLRVTYKWSK